MGSEVRYQDELDCCNGKRSTVLRRAESLRCDCDFTHRPLLCLRSLSSPVKLAASPKVCSLFPVVSHRFQIPGESLNKYLCRLGSLDRRPGYHVCIPGYIPSQTARSPTRLPRPIQGTGSDESYWRISPTTRPDPVAMLYSSWMCDPEATKEGSRWCKLRLVKLSGLHVQTGWWAGQVGEIEDFGGCCEGGNGR